MEPPHTCEAYSIHGRIRPLYRVSSCGGEKNLDKIIAEMLAQDIIEPSDSEWNFPSILQPRPDGTFRPVVDYRKLNERTVPDRLPLPVISDIFHSLGTENRYEYFSTIDIKSAL